MRKIAVNKNAEAKVYSDFLVGTAIAWFSAGIITPLFTKKFGFVDVALAFAGILIAVISLRIAVKYKVGEKGNG